MSDESFDGFEMKAGAGPLPGIYTGKFLGVKKTDPGDYGVGARFEWEIVGGLSSEIGKIAPRTGKPEATPNNVTGRFVAALIGPVPVGQRASLASAIGKSYAIVVEKSPKSENTRVVSVMPAST